jgi:Mn2+/Fe2+ NRAMP family transporter
MNKLKLFLPGLLVAATGVGAGDLISGALAGHYLGLLLWIPIVGALLKYILTEGIARYQFATGRPLVHGWIEDLGNWVKIPFLFYLLLWSYMVGGALINASGSSLNTLFPITHGKYIYGVCLSLLAIAIVLPGNFAFFEKIMTLLVGVMFFTVITTSFLFIDKPGELFLGFLSVKNLSLIDPWFLAVLGGVGGTLTILGYGYWLQENGRKGIEGLRESKIDLAMSYSLTALFSVSMMILGHQLPEVSKTGSIFINQVAQLFTLKIGPWGAILFKIGFFCGVFSSLLGVWQSVPYLFSDLFHLHYKLEVKDIKKTTAYRGYLLFIAILPMTSLLIKFQAIQLLYAVVGAFFIPICALSLIILNNGKNIPLEFKNKWITNLLLSITLIFFVINGVRLVF